MASLGWQMRQQWLDQKHSLSKACCKLSTDQDMLAQPVFLDCGGAIINALKLHVGNIANQHCNSLVGSQGQGKQEAWKSALARARGEKVLDDPKLLRK